MRIIKILGCNLSGFLANKMRKAGRECGNKGPHLQLAYPLPLDSVIDPLRNLCYALAKEALRAGYMILVVHTIFVKILFDFFS